MDSKEVFDDIRKKFKSIPYKMQYGFTPIALSLFAFHSPVYTERARRGWSYRDSVTKTGKYKVTFGNDEPSALFSEYGTLKHFAVNVVNVDGNILIPQITKKTPPRKYTSTRQDLIEWCNFKGITDPKIQHLIIERIIRDGRYSSVQPAKGFEPHGMAVALPHVYEVFKSLVRVTLK